MVIAVKIKQFQPSYSESRPIWLDFEESICDVSSMYPTRVSFYLDRDIFCWRMRETNASADYAIEKRNGFAVSQIGTARVVGLNVVSVSLTGDEKDGTDMVAKLLQAAILRTQ